MNNHLTDDTFLARWVSRELTPNELEAFKKSKEYPIYKKIIDASQLLEVSTYNKQEGFNKILQERVDYVQLAKPKVIKLVPNWTYAVAASIVIMFGIFYFLKKP